MPTISGTDFAARLPERPGPEREAAIYHAVAEDLFLPIVWVPVVSTWRGHEATFMVSSDALRIGNDADAIRVNASAETTQWIADLFGTVLPTPHLCNLIWEQAHHVLSPSLQRPDAEMAHTHRMVRHSREVDDKLRGRCGLVANVGKHWVLTNALRGRHPTRAANYGWFKPDGSVWQNVGLAHSQHHVDYSQVVRLVQREVYVDGLAVDIEYVGRSESLWGLVSNEGPLSVWAQPGAGPKPAPRPSPIGDIDSPAHRPNQWRELRIGMEGHDVGAWQRVLMDDGYDLSPYDDDEQFGRVTHNATLSWQGERGLPKTGVVDAATRAMIGKEPVVRPPSPTEIPFVAAKNFTPAGRSAVDLVVIHTMEAAEASTTAENVARWAAGPHAPRASWHYAIDDDSVVQCVKEEDVAWAAPSCNHNGIQLEHAGYARQTADQWADAFSTRMLERSAKLTAAICRRWNIPVRFIDAGGLLAGERGITTHYQVTLGPGRGRTDHTDPGPHFPMARYLELVEEALASTAS